MELLWEIVVIWFSSSFVLTPEPEGPRWYLNMGWNVNHFSRLRFQFDYFGWYFITSTFKWNVRTVVWETLNFSVLLGLPVFLIQWNSSMRISRLSGPPKWNALKMVWYVNKIKKKTLFGHVLSQTPQSRPVHQQKLTFPKSIYFLNRKN